MRKSYKRFYINKYERGFHDPWGNKNGNSCGSIIHAQYMVGQAELLDYYGEGSLNKNLFNLDKAKIWEHNHGRFTRTNSSIDKLRR